MPSSGDRTNVTSLHPICAYPRVTRVSAHARAYAMSFEKLQNAESQDGDSGEHRTTPRLEEGEGSDYADSIGGDVLGEQEEAEGLLASGAAAVAGSSLGRRVRGWFGQEKARSTRRSRRRARRGKKVEGENEQEVLYAFEGSEDDEDNDGERRDETAVRRAEPKDDALVVSLVLN